MALQTSGSITAADINEELGRAPNASFSMNGSEERAMAGKASGSIGFDDFYGKSSEIIKTLSSGTSAITLESLFTPEEWTGDTQKKVLLPSSASRANTTSTSAAITIGSTAWGGNLIFEVEGIVSGKGGAANGGIGGNAFQANRVGNANQKLILNIKSTGVLRGGGGGGGKGGDGGSGSKSETATIGPVYSEGTSTPRTMFVTTGTAYSGLASQIYWEGELVGTVPSGNTSGTFNGATYTKSGANPVYTWNEEFYGEAWWYVTRTGTVVTPTTGGTGGAGGRGEGADGSRASGVAGASGGVNAGAGGSGGAGGLYGATGGTGAPGSNGNVTNGASGSAGGLAGYGLLGLDNVILTNNGSILGRTG